MKFRDAAHIFGPLYSNVKFMQQYWQNMVWATFRANFSPSHLVTLARLDG
jgi:hypothetical protein